LWEVSFFHYKKDELVIGHFIYEKDIDLIQEHTALEQLDEGENEYPIYIARPTPYELMEFIKNGGFQDRSTYLPINN